MYLQAICEYFLKLTPAERERNGPYPHTHLLNKFIRNKQDSQLRGTSRNGQYSSRYADFFKKLDIVKRLVGALAEQNNVSTYRVINMLVYISGEVPALTISSKQVKMFTMNFVYLLLG